MGLVVINLQMKCSVSVISKSKLGLLSSTATLWHCAMAAKHEHDLSNSMH
uniref:Uncharacterized protein n=1 Tax=Arundo donax TaxID=35708 RepID=A0A0A9FV21_ARUDO